MNLLHIKYAVEVAKTNSINQAAERLYVGQSALSRAIKELEKNLGVTLFERSAKGMFPTADGEIFLRYARKILKQVEEMESVLVDGAVGKTRFSISTVRAGYVADAFSRFSLTVDADDAELTYRESGMLQTIRSVLREEAQIGIIRYSASYDAYFKSMLDERELDYEMIAQFENVLIMSHESPLAELESITRADLRDYFEITYTDPATPAVSMPTIQKDSLQEEGNERRIVLFERSACLTLLSQNPHTFIYTSPVSPEILERSGLIERECDDIGQRYKDVMIRRRGRKLTDLDCEFLEQLVHAKRRAFGAGSE